MASGGSRRSVLRLADLVRRGGSLGSSGNGGNAAAGSQWLTSAGVPHGEIAPFGSRAASTQIVRNRMKSVRSIQKITKAMKMVAASKLRMVQTRAENSRGLWQPFTALLGDNPELFPKQTVVMTVSSDKGLCGGINSTSVKTSKSVRAVGTDAGAENPKYIILGDKGRAQLQRDSRKNILMHLTELQKYPINFTQVSMMADDILKNVEYDAMKIVYNKFHSVIKSFPTVATILSPAWLKNQMEAGKLAELDLYEIEGDDNKAEMLQNLSEFQFAAVLYNALLENATSEQGARMSAMENSTKSATDMLDKLTMSYNRTRQASITTELIEIISGAAALEAQKS